MITREEEAQICKELAALAMDKTSTTLRRLLKEYRERSLERLASCSPEELGILQGEVKAYDKVLARISGK